MPDTDKIKIRGIQGWTDGDPEDFDNYSGGFVLMWEKRKVGWGEITFIAKSNNNGPQTIECDTEYMSREFVKEALCALADHVKIIK